MLNSEALRAGYNACLPLLSAYQTDLAQSEPLLPRLPHHRRARRRRRSAPSSSASSSTRCATFASPASGCPRSASERFKIVMQELTQLQAKFEENVLDATNAWSWHVTDADELRGLNDMLIELADAVPTSAA